MTRRFTDQSADLFYSWCRKEFPALEWAMLDGPSVCWSNQQGILGVLYGLPTHLSKDEWVAILRPFLEAYR